MWLGDDETMQGVGCPGGCQGTDGNLYQWVQGVDGLGNTVGYWQPAGQPASAPYSRQTAPFLGDVAEGPDGHLYQWVQGVDGLGSPFGFWKRVLRRAVQRALPFARQIAPFIPGASAALTAATPLLRHAGIQGPDGLGALYEAADGSMYQVQGVGAGDDLDGLADDELQGLAADDELNGLAADDELNGVGADDDLNGFAADDDFNGVGADEDLNGLAAAVVEDVAGVGADDDLNGIAADDVSGFAADDLDGIGDDDPTMSGYVRDRGINGIGDVDGFIPERPRRTPAFSPSPNAPMWTPIW